MGVFATDGSVKTLGAPRDVIDTTECVDVEKVEVGGRVEEEGEGACEDFPEILDSHEEDAVDGKWEDIEEHGGQDDIPQQIDEDTSSWQCIVQQCGILIRNNYINQSLQLSFPAKPLAISMMMTTKVSTAKSPNMVEK
jgi:hypothetical protein